MLVHRSLAPLRSGTSTAARTLPPTAARRSFASSSSVAPTRRQHLLWCGNLLGYTSDRLTKLPRAWLDSLGVSSDVDRGLEWTHLSASPTHTLLAYRLLSRRSDDPHAQVGGQEEGEDIILDANEEDDAPTTSSLPHKVLAMGRNTHAQLGLGFASQEATRGMVAGAFEGRGGVTAVCSGGSTSFIVTNPGDGEDGTGLYAFGNHSLGQLGLGPAASPAYSSDPYDVTPRLESGEAQLLLHPLPRQVDIDSALEQEATVKQGWKIDGIASGIDHSLLLRSREGEQGIEQQVLSTGFNTDGQLGLSTSLDVPIQPLISRVFERVPLPRLEAKDRFTAVAAGADTSFALAQSGRLFAWGNSEYGQAMLESGVEDRIIAPVEVTASLREAYGRAGLEWSGANVRKVVAGGSWAGVLDDQGRVFTAGYGPLGLGLASTDDASTSSDRPPAPRAAVQLTHLSCLPAGILDLHAGLDYGVAIAAAPTSPRTDGGKDGKNPLPLPRIFTWGLDTRAGRLGLGLGTTSSPSDRLRTDAARKSDRPSGIGMSTGVDPRNDAEEGVAQVYTPVEVPAVRLGQSPEDEWLDANPAEKRKRREAEEKRTTTNDTTTADRSEGSERERPRIVEVACGAEVMFVLVEDGRKDVGRWSECYGPPEPGTEVVA